MERLVETLPDDTPSIVLGDFNSLPASNVAKLLAGQEFIDSYEAVTPAAQREHTWQWQTRAATWAFRLDYLYHDPALRTHACEIVRSDGSDHDLLVSTLSWAPDEQASAKAAPASQPATADDASSESRAPIQPGDAPARPQS